MQADVILKDPLLWVPPVSLLGGARVGGGGGARPPPPRTRLGGIPAQNLVLCLILKN